MDTRSILDTLAHGTMLDTRDHTPVGQGITRPTRTLVGGIDAIVKHEPAPGHRNYGIDRAAAERMVYIVATVSPGLAIVPPTVVRLDNAGHRVSVAAWHAGSYGADDGESMRGTLRSDVIGTATLDYLTGCGADRHGHNWLVDYTHTDCVAGCVAHHGRVVAIDGGRAFHSYIPRGVFARAVSGHRIPQYLHDHLDRIIAARPILDREIARCGGDPAWAVGIMDRANDLRRAVTFPVALY